MRHHLLCSLIIFSCFFPGLAVAADQTATAELIALEIRNLSTSVDRLTQLLYEQGQQEQQDVILRKLDIAVAYLNFRSRRIEMLERDKQNSQTTKTRLEDIIGQLETRVEQLEDSEQGDTDGEANETARQETEEQLKMLKQRLARVDETLFDFDNQIIELRNQLDDVEGFVERHLEL
jgi:predicted nuclease with TOPRIM domain